MVNIYPIDWKKENEFDKAKKIIQKRKINPYVALPQLNLIHLMLGT